MFLENGLDHYRRDSSAEPPSDWLAHSRKICQFWCIR
jgi:hypothetical protein